MGRVAQQGDPAFGPMSDGIAVGKRPAPLSAARKEGQQTAPGLRLPERPLSIAKHIGASSTRRLKPILLTGRHEGGGT